MSSIGKEIPTTGSTESSKSEPSIGTPPTGEKLIDTTSAEEVPIVGSTTSKSGEETVAPTAPKSSEEPVPPESTQVPVSNPLEKESDQTTAGSTTEAKGFTGQETTGPTETKSGHEETTKEGEPGEEGKASPDFGASATTAGEDTIGKCDLQPGEKVVVAPPAPPESDNIIDLIIYDHKYAKHLYAIYETTEALEAKKTASNNLIKALVVHDECEQALVYPLLKEKIGGDAGKKHYERSIAEHQEQREMLYEIKNTNIKDDPEAFDNKLKKAMEAVCHHVDQEEKEVLPLLKEPLSEDELNKVGHSFKIRKPLVATRPHPDIPTTGPGAAVANIMLKPFDMARDFIEGNK